MAGLQFLPLQLCIELGRLLERLGCHEIEFSILLRRDMRGASRAKQGMNWESLMVA
jgi:hypothetical protein